MTSKKLYTWNMRKKTVFPLITLTLLLLSVPVTRARAENSIVIHDDGTISLFITHGFVLGASDDKTKSKPSTSPTSPPTETSVSLTRLHTESKITVTPPINDDKKIQVTITSVTPTQNPSSPVLPKNQSVVTIKTIEENVNEIVAQGTDEKPILSITSPTAHELQIKQQNVAVTTVLPLQIDSLTHSLGISSASQPATISVLPHEAVQGMIDEGLLDTKSLNGMKIYLATDSTGITYNVQSERQGRLFGIIPVASPVQVILSAQNGKVVKVSQSILFTILGKFVK